MDRYTTEAPESNTAWTPVDRIEVVGEYADSFPVVTNETPLEIMISEINNPYFLMAWMHDMQYFYPYDYNGENSDYGRYSDNACPSLERIVKGEAWLKFYYHLPINFLRKTGFGQYYTVCKQKGGGYVYIFFDRPRTISDYSVYDGSQDETNVFFYGVLYAEKSLCYDDFRDIKKGDSIDKVAFIDTAAVLPKTLLEWDTALYGPQYHSADGLSSLHLLTDGILEIYYTIEDSKLFVDSLAYYEDYMYMSSGLYRDTGNKAYMNLKVLPQDYPPEA